MSGTYRHGRIELDSRVDWPDGSRVQVVHGEEHFGLEESDWPDTAENRRALVAKLQDIEPLELTSEDEAEIESARRAFREFTLEAMRKRMDVP